MLRQIGVAAALLAIVPDSAVAQIVTPVASASERGLAAAEDARFQAQVARDATMVARGLADELIYTHANGRVQDKAAVVAGIAGGAVPYRAVAAHDRIVRVFGTVGMIRGVREATVGDRTMTDSYLAVYVRRDGRWQLLAWQTSPGPAGVGAGAG